MKNEYLNELKNELVKEDYQDIDEIINYFKEIIEDKISDGNDEETVINNLVNPKQLVQLIKDDNTNSDDFSYQEEIFNFDDDMHSHEFNKDEVKTIDIQNTFINLKIVVHDSDKVIFKYNKNNSYDFHVDLSKGYLTIEFQNSFKNFFKNNYKNDECYLYIPKDTNYEYNIETVNATVNIYDIDATIINLESVNGNININDITSKEVNLESVSANVIISNTYIKNLNIETVSGNIDLKLKNKKDETYIHIENINDDITLNSNVSKNQINIDTVCAKVNYDFI